MSDPYHTSWPPRPWIHRSERPLSHIGPAHRLFSSAQPLSHIVPSHRILDPTFNRTPMRIAILQKSFPGVLPRSPPQVESTTVSHFRILSQFRTHVNEDYAPGESSPGESSQESPPQESPPQERAAVSAAALCPVQQNGPHLGLPAVQAQLFPGLIQRTPQEHHAGAPPSRRNSPPRPLQKTPWGFIH